MSDGSGGHRRQDIQGLRALAVVIVVAFHAGAGFSGGFIGVDVFFVISGFVITALLTRELDPTNTLRLGRFYLRRIRRLMPALALVVVVVALASILAAPVGVQPMAARTGVSASAFLANFYLYTTPNGYFALDADLNPFLHTWSLAVEEQFYLVFPVLLLGCWRLGARRGTSRRVAIGVLALVAIGSFVLSEAMVRGTAVLPGIDSPREFAFYSSITRAWEFAAGALLALAITRLARMPKAAAHGLGIVGGLAILVPAVRYDDLTAFPGLTALPPVLGTLALIAAGTSGAVGVSRLLTTRPATWIGDISYSWYLWHWPFIVFARALWPGSLSAPIAATVSLVPAVLSYRLVENPIRHAAGLTGRRTLILGTASILAGVLACGALVLGHRGVVGTDGYASVKQAQRTHRACPDGGKEARRARRANDPEVAVRCTWPVGTAGTIALLGDSNAGHIVEPTVAAARTLDRAVYVATSNGCPFADVTMVDAGERRSDCRRFYEASMRTIQEDRPDLVVLGATTSRYIDEARFGIAVGRSPRVATSSDAKARAWTQGLGSTVDRLDAAGIATIVVQPVPKYPGWDLRGCAAGRVVLAEFTCGRATGRAAAVRAGTAARRAATRAIADSPRAELVDFLPQLCSATRCATDRDEIWLYHDGDHLSIIGAQRLTPTMRQAFERALASR